MDMPRWDRDTTLLAMSLSIDYGVQGAGDPTTGDARKRRTQDGMYRPRAAVVATNSFRRKRRLPLAMAIPADGSRTTPAR